MRAYPFSVSQIDDQICLLINSWCELLLFSCCYRSIETPGEVRISFGKSISLAQAKVNGLQVSEWRCAVLPLLLLLLLSRTRALIVRFSWFLRPGVHRAHAEPDRSSATAARRQVRVRCDEGDRAAAVG